MIDTLALALTHGLMLLVAWRLLSRPDLDDEDADSAKPTHRTRARRSAKPRA